ncbi:MAG: four helix bundle protein [Planctomycetes bacterium]|nr:four helix bundle protein [Planctomycetota bacterium]
MIKSYRDLIVWQKAHVLVLNIYNIIQKFPAEEKFALISQIRRAAISVPANIVEGFRRNGMRDKINFYNYAQSSLDELEYEMFLAQELGYYSNFEALEERINEVAKLLSGLIKSIKNSSQAS